MKNTVLLISLYNPKSLGLRCLEKSLDLEGYNTKIVYLKDFNSKNPSTITDNELKLLADIIEDASPLLIGLSVMTSLYLDAALKVSDYIKKSFDIPLVWGGIHASLFPQKSLKHADFVIIGEGENALVDLTNAISKNLTLKYIPNLVYKNRQFTLYNEVAPPISDIDNYSLPIFDNTNKYFIENNKLSHLRVSRTVSYELTSSRGCPFSCSYCCSPAIKKLYSGKGSYLRFRSPSNIIEELLAAIKHLDTIKSIHFWDEIFPSNKSWIDEFCSAYKDKIGLPFQIWCHPLTVNQNAIEKLVDAGLKSVVMGIQSGSSKIRRVIFNRSEKQYQILNAAKILNKACVPHVTYDFMLRHPFENVTDIKHSYMLCKKLPHPFKLQLHGLYFIPGAEITQKAIEMGYITEESNEGSQSPSLVDKYNIYWGKNKSDLDHDFWYSMIFFTQYPTLKRFREFMEKRAQYTTIKHAAIAFYNILNPLSQIIGKFRKLLLLAKSLPGILFSKLHDILLKIFNAKNVATQK